MGGTSSPERRLDSKRYSVKCMRYQMSAENIICLHHRIVYSPHVYGPDVYRQVYFNAATFPSNMPEIWTDHFGYLCTQSDRCVCLGEWGGFGKKGSKDLKWQCELAKYIKYKMMGNNFYWCLNPDSGDTGGLLGNNWDLHTPI